MGVTTMDADDCAVLNMLARSEAPAPQNTASSKTEPTVEDYKLSGKTSIMLNNYWVNLGRV